jgi:hypothetical protein
MAQKGTEKTAGSRGEEEPVALDVTYDGETRTATVSRMATPKTEVRFKNNTVTVTVSCKLTS